MTHILKQFRHVPLPTAMPTDDLSTSKSDAGIRNSLAGAYDYFGGDRRFPRIHLFRHKGMYVGEIVYRVTSDGDYRVTSDDDYRVAAAAKVADLTGKVNDLKSEVGNWGELWRERLTDGQMTYKWCRLLAVRHQEEVDNANAVSEVESEYETMDVGWRSEDAILVAASASAGVGVSLLVQNSGSIPVQDAILRIEATSGTITQITIVGSGMDITWTGNLDSGGTLILDAGEQSITTDDVDDYDGLAFNAGHTSDEWLSLPVGMSQFIVTVTGGNADIELEYNNQWP